MLSPGYVHTLTLYNRIRAADTPDRKERWIRTVLHNCFWKSQIQTGFRDTGVSSQNVYVVRIPEMPGICLMQDLQNSKREGLRFPRGILLFWENAKRKSPVKRVTQWHRY